MFLMTTFRLIRQLTFLSLFTLVLTGCSGDVTPDGMPNLQPLALTVTQQGAPLEGASVQLIATDPANSRWASGGTTDAEGKVVLKTLGQYEGVVPGTYKVTFYKMATEGNAAAPAVDSPSSGGSTEAFLVIDPKYQTETTTPVEIAVVQGVDSLPAIDLGAPVKIAQMPM